MQAKLSQEKADACLRHMNKQQVGMRLLCVSDGVACLQACLLA